MSGVVHIAGDLFVSMPDGGSLNLGTGDYVVLSGFGLNDTSADLGLYNTNSFANAAAMEDFVQYGGSGIGRESVAASKGI